MSARTYASNSSGPRNTTHNSGFAGPHMGASIPTAGMGRTVFRNGVGGAMGLVAFGQGMKTVESLRYGQIGTAAMHAGIAAAAGYGSYQMLFNKPQFTNAMKVAGTFAEKAMGGAPSGSFFARHAGTVANFLKGF